MEDIPPSTHAHNLKIRPVLQMHEQPKLNIICDLSQPGVICGTTNYINNCRGIPSNSTLLSPNSSPNITAVNKAKPSTAVADMTDSFGE